MRFDEQNRILISYKEIVPNIWNENTYDSLKRRGNIVTTHRGGGGHPTEIIFDECKPRYQEKMRGALGELDALLRSREMKGEPVLSLNDLTIKELEVCRARYEIVMQYRRYAELNKETAKGVTNAKKQFVDLVVAGVWCQEAFKTVGKISFPTVERWNKMLRDHNDSMASLAPERKKSNAEAGLSEEQRKLLIELYCTPNQPTLSDSIRLAMSIWKAKGDGLPSEPKCRRFMTEWLKENEAIAVFRRKGLKAMKDGFLPYLERDPESIKFMDVFVSDGHVMNFQVDYTVQGKDGREVHKVGRPTMVAWQDMKTGLIMGFELMMTENTMSVASSFRLSCLNAARLCGSADCAILPKVVYMDNGKAFKNKYFNATPDFKSSIGGLFEQLKAYGLSVQYALPYNAPSKVIERSWRNFLEVEKQAISYTGDCIDNKPARMMRNEVWHREVYKEELNAHGMLTLQGAYRLLERWITEYNARQGNGKYLQGRSPLELAEEQIPEIDFSGRILKATDLNYMIMQRRTCLIQRNGVQINGNWYYNAREFVLLPKGQIDAIVKYDMFHPDKVYVFRTDGSFWCEAGFYKGNNVHAMARLGSDAEQRRYREAIRENKRIEHAVTLAGRTIAQSGVTLVLGERDLLPEQKTEGLPVHEEEDFDELKLF